MTVFDALLEANRALTANWTPPPAPAAPRIALVLCMDARIDPIRVLGIPPGHAHIIRNAGGRMVDAVRSLVISQQVIGTEEVALVHHTECGMVTFTERELRHRLEKRFGVSADALDLHPFTELRQSVRQDLELYRRSPFLRQDIPVRGFIYDVATAHFSEVYGRNKPLDTSG